MMGGRRVSRTQKLELSYGDCLAEVGMMEGEVGHQAAEPEEISFLASLSFFLEIFSVFTGPIPDSSDD